MLDELRRKLVLLLKTRTSAPYAPPLPDDVVARKTDWWPIVPGGSNFRTHRLVEKDLGRIEFRPTAASLAFSLFFLIGGITVLAALIATFISKGRFPLPTVFAIIALLVAAVFTWGGTFLLKSAIAPIVFDRGLGFYWKGWKKPDVLTAAAASAAFTALGSIHALQIVEEYCVGDESSYYSYELNLVLRDGKRLNVVDHGNLKRLRQDAARLSAFLGKPVWDMARDKK